MGKRGAGSGKEGTVQGGQLFRGDNCSEGAVTKVGQVTERYLALSMPRNTGKGSGYHMVFWEEHFVIFICFQKCEYLGALKYFVSMRGDPPK